jgi:UDP-N-acetylmuramoyl-L-alanyl-D-glutamate--2,6-diaminopimelate ligase
MNSNPSKTTTNCSLRALLQGFIEVTDPWDVFISGIAQDSREVQPGDAFLACRGHQTDGRRHIDDAVSKGAVAIIANTHPGEGFFKGCSYYVSENNASSSVLNNTSKKADEKNISSNIPLIAIDDLQGKLGLIASRFYNHPSHQMAIIGITGTNGKTSTSQFIAGSLQALGRPCGVIGTLGYGLFNQLTLGSLTTPDAVTLQKYFNTFLHQQAQAVSMEVSSHSLALKRVCGIEFSIAVFTNLTRDHLDFHGDMKQYGDAKRKLFEMPGVKQAVINADDDFGRQLLVEFHSRLSLVGYSIEKDLQYDIQKDVQKDVQKDIQKYTGLPATVFPPLPPDIPMVYANEIVLHPSGITAMIHTPWGRGKLQSALLGRFNLSNLLAAFSVLAMMGVEFNKALDAINQVKGVAGRLQVIKCKNGVLAVIDYAHTPDALQQALIALREHCSGHLWCVFGCGGDRDKGKRPLMAKIAERFSDEVVITTDNPRHEAPLAIIADILEGLSNSKKAHVEADRRLAIEYALQTAQKGDVVLIAGKGHETYQQIGDEKFSFDDVEVVNSTQTLLV